jgi:RND family efflux transporter MFP subunit
VKPAGKSNLLNYKWLLGVHCILQALFVLGGCGGTAGNQVQTPPPAKVQRAPAETELATITLSVEAEKRLGIELVAVEYRPVSRSRQFGGEVIVPDGRVAVVAAPVAGRLLAAEGGVPAAGTRVRAGKTVFWLVAIPTESDLVRLREELEQAQIRASLARQRAQRTEQLLRDKAGSQRSKEEADAELGRAENALAAARARMDLLGLGSADTSPAGLAPLMIAAPLSGVLREIRVQPGQMVAAGTPLFEVANLEVMWVRVPVFVGELPEIETAAPAQIHDPAGNATNRSRRGRAVAAPPVADASASSADLFYEISNQDGAFRPGQRVGVTLALRDTEKSLVVPWAAILHDIQGSTWVYVNTAPQTYQRQRVEVQRVASDLAVLRRGPAVGAKVVTAGAAELFGTEFATGK